VLPIHPELILSKQFLISFEREFQYIFVRNIKYYKNSILRQPDKFVSNVLKYEDKLLFHMEINYSSQPKERKW
jgi:hypothetical protein